MTPLKFDCPHCGLKMFVAQPGGEVVDDAIDATLAKGIPVLAHEVPKCRPYERMVERVPRNGKLRRTRYWESMRLRILAAQADRGRETLQ